MAINVELHFLASSGRKCIVTCTHDQNHRMVFLAEWQDSGLNTTADRTELDAWFPGALLEATGIDAGDYQSTVENDDARREVLSQAFIHDAMTRN